MLFLLLLSFSVPDDDSEPILGQWFEETISPSKEKVAPPPPPPPPPLESSPRVKSPSKQAPGEKGNILASRKDPELVRVDFWSLGEGEMGRRGVKSRPFELRHFVDWLINCHV